LPSFTHALTILNQEQIRRIIARIMDPNEFLSDYGVRSLSKAHKEHPFFFDGQFVGYERAGIPREHWRSGKAFPLEQNGELVPFLKDAIGVALKIIQLCEVR